MRHYRPSAQESIDLSLRFSQDGPAFPEQLVDALLAGEVVFLCGAGISTPQLPMFGQLVKDCVERLGLEKNSSEIASFDKGRYEEVLGSLSRRTVDTRDVPQTVVSILQKCSEGADLAYHQTILKLSRNLDNRPTVITTNFDTLLERALEVTEGPGFSQHFSFAGQDLPLPGSPEFCGIIHLHGRMADETIDLKQTPMVLTSAEYGDAYMRSGWASRFLFDLCRCKTVVLVGYSAGDAPVRYFLNVLEADRTRFSDVHPVYAFASVISKDDPDTEWSTLAVRPLAYERTEDDQGKQCHDPLWRDLESLAELVERPRSIRKAWAVRIIGKLYKNAEPDELDFVQWLFTGRRDLFSTAINTINDPNWFTFFYSQKIWDERDTSSIVASWVTQDLSSAIRYWKAIHWVDELGITFVEALRKSLENTPPPAGLWRHAWRVLAASRPAGREIPDLRLYKAIKVISEPTVLQSDVYNAIELIAPSFKITPRYASNDSPPLRLSDIINVDWSVGESHEVEDLIAALLVLPNPSKVLKIASSTLERFVSTSLDLDEIDAEYDRNDYAVPSIEPHMQNEHYDGPIFLIQLIARLIEASTKENIHATLEIVNSWPHMPGILGTRLWMHSLRDKNLFSDDEAIDGAVNASLGAFWGIPRELPLILRDRSMNASPVALEKIENRILLEGEMYYQRFEIESNEIDWRDHARDLAVWLRLNMLKTAGVLSENGKAELQLIKERREYLDREVEDQDFFGSYSYGVQTIDGDPQPLIEATDEDRLNLAQEIAKNPDLRKQLGWGVFCRSDASAAFATLSAAAPTTKNSKLWNTFLNSLLASQDGDETNRLQVIAKALKFIDSADDDFLTDVIRSLSQLYLSTPYQIRSAEQHWWRKLFQIAVERSLTPLDAPDTLYNDAINSPGGRLTQALLADIDQCTKKKEAVPSHLLDNIEIAVTATSREGVFARAILVRNISFILSLNNEDINKLIECSLSGDSVEAVALRSILVNYTENSAATSKRFSHAILRGVIEVKGRGGVARSAAAKIIAPAISHLRNEENASRWGISLEQTDTALKKGPPTLRIGACILLKQWMPELAADRAKMWRTSVGPLLARWSRDRDLCEKELTHHFAEIAIASGDAFPDALNQIFPYLTLQQGYGSLYSLTNSDIPEKFPRDTLALVWRIFGPGCVVIPYEVSKIIDRLIKAEPLLERDRRLQWLDQNSIRFD